MKHKKPKSARRIDRLRRDVDEGVFDGVIQAATRQELENPKIVLASASRMRRIINGSGQSPAQVRLCFLALRDSTDGMNPRAFMEWKARGIAFELRKKDPFIAEGTLDEITEVVLRHITEIFDLGRNEHSERIAQALLEASPASLLKRMDSHDHDETIPGSGIGRYERAPRIKADDISTIEVKP